MQAHKVATTLTQDGILNLSGLPFRAGMQVEVIVLSQGSPTRGQEPFPLRGTVLHYEAPAEPIAMEDWGVLK